MSVLLQLAANAKALFESVLIFRPSVWVEPEENSFLLFVDFEMGQHSYVAAIRLTQHEIESSDGWSLRVKQLAARANAAHILYTGQL